MKKTLHSTDSQVLKRIRGHGKGWVFTPNHFIDLGSRDAVASALKRHKQAGHIRQLAHGLYDYPKTDPKLGLLEPSMDDIVSVLAGRDVVRLQPTGAYAANLLGLSTQVPMKISYLTDGLSKTVSIGKRQIILKRTTPRNMAMAGRVSGLVNQALKYLGKDQVDQSIITRLKDRLDNSARVQLLKDIKYVPAWIAKVFQQITQVQDTV
ncbi:MAG: hypothetical protein HQ507_03525 [Candidatus Marinimicrobia bacterium]|nr:hypothetical protein [Candidatus Neomarinimicrobiota bacterium]